MPLFSLSNKLSVTLAQSADVTEASSTNPVDIPGLSITLPRAGTYHIQAVCPGTAADATSRTFGLGVAYSGSVTQLAAQIYFGAPGGVAAFGVQTTAGTLATRASNTGTSDRYLFFGVIKVSTGGILKMQFSRSAASLTMLNGVMTVREG